MIDNLVGLLLNYVLLIIVERISVRWTNKLLSGQYGRSIEEHNNIWVLQVLVWNGIIVINKLVILFVIILPLVESLYAMGVFLLEPLTGHPRWELLFVMIVVPAVLNVMLFWIQVS